MARFQPFLHDSDAAPNFQLVLDEIDAWMHYNFPGETRVTAMLGLVEEVGELARAILKQNQGIRGTFEEWDEEIRKEIGDVMAKLEHVALLCNKDLVGVTWWRWKEVRQRDWIKNPIGHGVPTEVDKTETTQGVK
jgi:NTP pyrophosphatase (non-canonical NTP hydrolase)